MAKKKRNKKGKREQTDKQKFEDKGTLQPGTGGPVDDSANQPQAKDTGESTGPQDDIAEKLKKKQSTLDPLSKPRPARKDPSTTPTMVMSDIDFSDPGEENFSKTMNPQSMLGRQATDWSRLLDEIKAPTDEAAAAQPAPGAAPAEQKSAPAKKKPTSATPPGSTPGKDSTPSLDGILKVRTRPVSGGEPFKPEDNPDYEILTKLAEGGMGVVYIARQTALNRRLAFKTLKPLSDAQKKQFADENRATEVRRQRQEMFLSEAVVTANLVHPNIVPIHDLGRTFDGNPFYSMKRVEGIPWEDRLSTMSIDENIDILLKVCDAVAYSHHNGVINRDLKPENVMLGEFGEVIVLDWGLAAQAPDAVAKVAAAGTATTLGAGTALYMAPEMMKGPTNKIGRCSDIYLLGGILFEILTGKPPHAAENSYTEMFRSIGENKLQSTDVTGELINIAYRALETEPADRYQSVQEFQLAIRTYLRHEESRNLTIRADELVQTAAAKADNYDEYQNAVALYGQALIAWPENKEADQRLANTRLEFAEAARKRGDYDLGLQVIGQDDAPESISVRKRLMGAKRKREAAKYTIMGSILALFIGGAAFTVYAVQAEREAQNQLTEIKKLSGEKEDLEADKVRIKEESDTLVATAKTEAETAKRTAKEEADRLIMNATEMAKKQVAAAEMRADEVKKEADMLVMTAEAEAKKQVADATMEAAKRVAAADKLVMTAKEQAKASVDLANLEVKRTEVQSDITVALRDIQSGDYPEAMRKIEQLLNGNTIDSLEPNVAARRKKELSARLDDLRKRGVAPTASPIQTGAVSRDGKTVVSGNTQGTVSVFSIETGNINKTPVATYQLDDAGTVRPIAALVTSDDGTLVCAAAGSTIRSWIQNGAPTTYPGHSGNVRSLQIRQSGSAAWLISGADSGEILIHDLATGNKLGESKAASIRDIVVLSDANMLIVAGSRGGQSVECTAYTFSNDGKTLTRHSALDMRGVDVRNPIANLALTRDGSFLAVSNTRDGRLMVLPRRKSLAENQFPFLNPAEVSNRKWQFKAHVGPVTNFAFSPTANRLVTGSVDQTVRVWDYKTDSGTFQEQLVKSLRGHGGPIETCGFLGSTGQLVSMSRDRFVRTWELDKYDAEREQLEREFSPDADTAAAPESTTLRAPESRLHTPVSYLPKFARIELKMSPAQKKNDGGATVLNEDLQRAHEGTIRSVRVNSDGSRILTASDDRTARIWEITTGAPLGGISAPDSRPGIFTEGHRFNIESFSFFHDGKRLLTSGFDGTVSIWDAEGGNNDGIGFELGRISGVGVQNAAAISADDKLIATSGYRAGATKDDDPVILGLVWKTADVIAGNRTPFCEVTGFHRKRVSAIAISPDGTRIATGSIDGAVAVWDIAQKLTIAESRSAHGKNTVTSLTFLDNDRLMTAGGDGQIAIRSIDATAKTLKSQTRLADEKGQIDQIAIAPDATRLLYVSAVERKDLTRDERKRVSPQTTLHITTLDGKDARAIDLEFLKRLLGKQPDSLFEILSVAWSPDGTRAALVISWFDSKDSRTADRILHVFETTNWRPVMAMREADAPPLAAVYAPGDGNLLATYDGLTAHLWDLKNHKHKAAFRPHATVFAADFSPDQKYVVTASDAVRIFDGNESSPRFGQTLFKSDSQQNGKITDVEFSPKTDSYQFVSSRADGVVKVWSWKLDSDGIRGQVELVRSLAGHTNAVRQATWSPDGSRVLSVGDDGQPRLWDLTRPNSQPTVIQLAATGVRFACCDFSADGKWVAAGGRDQSEESVAWVWNIERLLAGQMTPHTMIRGHRLGGITAISFVADGPYVATGGSDGAVLMWDWWKDQPATAEPHVAFESFRMIGEDTTAKVGSVDRLREAHAGPVTSIDASFPGRIVTGSDDGTAVIWIDRITSTNDAA